MGMFQFRFSGCWASGLTYFFFQCLAEMMKETPDVARRRGEVQEMRSLLQKALEIVHEVRDFNSFLPGGSK